MSEGPFSKGQVDYDDIPDDMNNEYVDEYNNDDEANNSTSYYEYQEIRSQEDYS